MRYRDRNPDNPANWQMLCSDCNERIDQDIKKTVGQVQREHFEAKHGSGNVRVSLKWVGLGPAPRRAPASLLN